MHETEVDFHEAANRICVAWAKLTERMLAEESVWVSRGGTWDAQQFLECLNEARDVDPTGVTAVMMAQAAAEQVLHETSFTGHTLLHRRSDVEAGLKEIEAIWKEMADPTFQKEVEEFKQRIEAVLKVYKVDEEKKLLQVRRLMASPMDFAFLRRDAIVTARKGMRCDQFSWGEAQGKNLGVNKALWQVHDINEALVAIRGQEKPAMSLIAFPQASEHKVAGYEKEWFFGWVVRNGGSVTLVWDAEQYRVLSEEQKQYASRYDARSWHGHTEVKSWFPTGLLVAKEIEEKVASASYVALDRPNEFMKNLGEINRAPAHSILWLIMVQEILNVRFGRNNERIAKPSFTARMVREPAMLTGGTLALPAPKLAAAAVTAKQVAPKARGRRKFPKHLQWMEDRYGPKVPQAMFDIIGQTEVKQLTASSGLAKEDVFGREKESPLSFVPETAIGTEDELEAMRIEVAMKNKITMMERLAEQEFKETRAELDDWLHEMAMRRKDALISAAIAGRFVAACAPKDHYWNEPKQVGLAPKNIMHIGWADDIYDAMRGQQHHVGVPKRHGEYRTDDDMDGPKSLLCGHINGGRETDGMDWHWRNEERVQYQKYTNRFHCAIYPEEWARFHATVEPNCPEGLAQVLGIDVDELPWQLRHWYASQASPPNERAENDDEKYYSSRSISNPWDKPFEHIVFAVSLSAKAYNELRKKRGLAEAAKNRHLLVWTKQRRVSLDYVRFVVCAPTSKKAANRIHGSKERGYQEREGASELPQTEENVAVLLKAQTRPEVPLWQHPESKEWAFVDDFDVVVKEVDRVFNERKVKEHLEKSEREAAEKAKDDAEEVAELKEELGLDSEDDGAEDVEDDSEE